jgi:DNA-binding NtrC family response regulator
LNSDSADFDLLVLDLRMPGIDGIGVLQHLADHDRWLPTVVASAHMDEAIVGMALRLGAVDFLGKPVRPDELRSTVQLVLQEESRFIASGDGLHRAEDAVLNARAFMRRRNHAEALAILQSRSGLTPEQTVWLRAATVAAESRTSEHAKIELRQLIQWNSPRP